MAQLSYMDAISLGWPAVQAMTNGDGSDYETIVWLSGPPLPTKEALDSWIEANPNITNVNEVTKYQFRKLYTLTERVAVDNAPNNTAIPAQYRAILVTMLKDLEVSGIVQLWNPDVQAGVRLCETLGLIGPGRSNQILSNLPPA
jgi:hypothetical protein